LIFPSGYQTNNALLSTLCGKGDIILLDKLVHASIIDGAQASGAEVRIWPHRSTGKLVRLLERGGYARAFIATDSLFSMDGDRAPLAELADIKGRYEAMLIVDEAHAFGCIGPEGKGCAAADSMLEAVDIVVGTFSKALGGVGGFAVCEKVIAEYLVNRARGFIYTTGVPAVHCLAAGAALDVLEAEPKRRERLRDNGDYFRKHCRALGLDTGESDSYIVPVILGSDERAARVAVLLKERGYLVPAIRPPTVKAGTARLRVSLMSEHSRADIDSLSNALKDILQGI
jgi:7-keto-8-aminopelargonate synthetase-like enzyme